MQVWHRKLLGAVLAKAPPRDTVRTLSLCASPAASKPQMRIGKWPCLAATFTLCMLLLQRCGRDEPSPDDVLLKRCYEELHARTLAAAAAQHVSKCSPWQRASSLPALLRARAWCLLEAWHSLGEALGSQQPVDPSGRQRLARPGSSRGAGARPPPGRSRPA